MTELYHNWRSLIRPRSIVSEDGPNPERFGKFVAKPLEPGFGTTLGNALRRVLLSSLQGTAITSVRIDGVLHEKAVQVHLPMLLARAPVVAVLV